MIDSPEAKFAVAAVREAAQLVRRVQAEMVTDALEKGDKSPVTVGDFVAAAGRNGRVFIIDPDSGSSVGRTRVYSGVSVPPASSENAIFVASRDQSLWAFEARQGTTRWRVRTEGPLTRKPVQSGGVVYCVIPKKGLCAYDANTGETLWESGVDADAVCTIGDRLLAWDGSRLHSIQASTGDAIDTFAMPGVDLVLADAFDGGNLYTVSTKSGEMATTRMAGAVSPESTACQVVPKSVER